MRLPHSLKTVTMLPLTAGVIALAAHGCARQPATEPLAHTARKVPPESSPGGTSADPEGREEFARALDAKRARLDEEIRELQAHIGSLRDAAKAEWTEKMAEVAAKRKAAEAKLDEVHKSAEGAWEHLREGVDRAWEDLEQAVHKARNEF